MSETLTASEALQNYLRAMSAMDVDAIVALLDDHVLIEIPFLKPNRLVGRGEARKGHDAIFTTLEAIEIIPSNVESNASHAIAECTLSVTRDGGEPENFQAGLVTETRGARLARISLYCNARNIRPWSDKSIL